MALDLESIDLPNRDIPAMSIIGQDEHTAFVDGVRVDVYYLISLAQVEELPIEEMPISWFSSRLDTECWTDENGERLKPIQVIEILREELPKAHTWEQLRDILSDAYPQFVRHFEQVFFADLNYPCLVHNDVLFDGAHRLVKAVLLGRSTIQVRVIGEIPEEAIVDE